MIIKRIPKIVATYLTMPIFINKIKKLKQDDECLITLFPHYGDIVYGMLYAKQHKIETGLKTVVLCSEKDVKFVKNYDYIDKIIAYKDNSLTAEYVANLSLKPKQMKKYNILTTVPNRLCFKNKSAKEVYKDVIYTVKEDNIQLLTLPKTQVASIENFDKLKSKIVVLNPYSASMRINKKYFQILADILNQKGFIIYTNVVKKQKPLNGTLPLRCSVLELYSILDQIFAFVSIRSGIVDLALSSNAKVFCLVPKKWAIDYFNLYELKTENVFQMYVKNKKQEKELIENFEKFILKYIKN